MGFFQSLRKMMPFGVAFFLVGVQAAAVFAEEPNFLKNGGSKVGVQVKIESFKKSDAESIRSSGFDFVRFGVWTDNVSNAAYQAKVKEAFAAADHAKLPVLLTVRSTVSLVTKLSGEEVNAPAMERAGQNFADQVVELEKTYPHQILAVELWNEPNLPKYWPTGEFAKNFAPFMSAVCRTLVKSRPQPPTFGFGFANPPTSDPVSDRVLKDILDNTPDCIDAVSYHTYEASMGVIKVGYQAVKKEYQLPVVISEWGATSLFMRGGEGRQAENVGNFIREAKGTGIPLVSIYEWKDNDSAQGDRERNFGLMKSGSVPKQSMEVVNKALQSK
jgi:polysaccharide biosynthesis protein PslG